MQSNITQTEFPITGSSNGNLHFKHITVQEYPDGLILIADEHVTSDDVLNLPNSVLSFIQTRVGGNNFCEKMANHLLNEGDFIISFKGGVK